MRNGHFPPIGLGLVLLVLTIGCAPKTPKTTASHAQPILDAGYIALENQQYADAIAKAEEFLSTNPAGPGSAEALYLKGRGFEGKNTAGVSTTEAADNLQAARVAYIQGLELNPREPLKSYLHTSLGNVCYFQDDYASAIGQLKVAYDKLDNEDVRAWVLYRVGLCQQRLGDFDQADRTFASVQDKHPDTIPAQRAREHAGARSFQVQLATFSNPTLAEDAIADLRRQGVAANRVMDSQGRALIRVGPIGSYTQAQYVKARFATKYPDAFILP
jgi:TolA-binding protein